MAMNINKPNQLFNLSFTGKLSIEKVGLLLIVSAVMVFVGYFVVSAISKDKQITPLSNTDMTSGINQLREVSDNFYGAFNRPKEAAPAPIVKEEAIAAPAPVIKSPAPKKLTFDEVFEVMPRPKASSVEVWRRQYLAEANHATQIRTFRSFGDFKGDALKKEAPINPDYQSEHVSASYPVDFSRTLTADRNISALLINEIDSSLAGKVTAQIEDNIYAAHGRLILIPAGSRAIGYYQPLEKVGDTRLNIIWSRIITPQGVDIIVNAEMADQMGRSGLGGAVDTRFFERYGLTLLISTINALAQYSIKTDSQNQAVFINTYGEDLSNISAKILEEQINIKPVIRINAGSRLLISPTRDIWFRDDNGRIVMQAAGTANSHYLGLKQ